MLKYFLLSALAVTLSACAIHPLPDDVTRINTYEIVRKIRCEARTAIKQIAVAQMEQDSALAETPNRRRELHELAKDFDNHFEKWRTFPFYKFSRRTQQLADKYKDGAIHYDFQFTMSEENNFSTEVNMLANLRVGTDNLGLSASNKRKRANVRAFRVKDTFAAILSERLTCVNTRNGPNYSYPISGEIGLKELIQTFLDLNENHNLSFDDKKSNLMVETLTFTTNIVGSATPKIVLNPLGKRLSLLNGSIAGELKRSDEHQVLIGLALPEKDGRQIKGPVPLGYLPSFRLGLSTDRNTYTYQLDQLMSYQLQQQTLRSIGDQRSIQIQLF